MDAPYELPLAEAATVSTGKIISRSFALWSKHLPLFGVVTLLTMAPAVVVTVYVVPQLGALGGLVERLSDLAFGALATASVLYGVIRRLTGRSASVGGCLATGLSRLVPVIGTSIAIGLITVALPAFAAFLLAMVLGAIEKSLTTVAAIAAAIAVVWLSSVFWVAVPAVVAERCWVSDALSRSAQLTRGHRFKIFLLYLLFFGIAIGLGGGVGYLHGEGVLDPLEFMGALFAAEVLAGSLMSVANGVAYHDLRRSVEGVDAEALVDVFA